MGGVSKSFQSSNKYILYFFIKLIIFVVAVTMLYSFVLKPVRVPDKVLTETIGNGTVAGINILFPENIQVTCDVDTVRPDIVYVRHKGKVFLRIFDACNGLDLIFIYLILIVLLPFYSFTRKLVFSIAGTLVIILANIIRCIALYWIFIFHKSYFDFNHHYVFTILIYLLIFYGWLLFTKGGTTNEIK